jgi:hypothetical protein
MHNISWKRDRLLLKAAIGGQQAKRIPAIVRGMHTAYDGDELIGGTRDQRCSCQHIASMPFSCWFILPLSLVIQLLQSPSLRPPYFDNASMDYNLTSNSLASSDQFCIQSAGATNSPLPASPSTTTSTTQDTNISASNPDSLSKKSVALDSSSDDAHPGVEPVAVSLSRGPSSSTSPFNISALRTRLAHLRSQSTSASITSGGAGGLNNQSISTLTPPISSTPSIASVPVLVTAYSGPRLRPYSSSHRRSSAMGPRANASQSDPSLPSMSSFSFAHILTTIEPQIQESLDAISIICARSRYSLADEYAAHLPPQGEIRAGAELPIRGRHGLWIRTAGLEGSGAALSVVHEASSSSGASETGTMRSAYGSLRDVLMNKGKAPAADNGSGIEKYSTQSDMKSSSSGVSYTWAVVRKDGGKNESIVLVSPPQASRQLSTTLVLEQALDGYLEPILASSLPPTPSAGMPAWLLPWRRSPSPSEENLDRPSAESTLRSLFAPPSSHTRHSGIG